MGFINLNNILFDNGLIIAVITINMTIIGLTSLAETKKVIGVDYGKFLVKRYRVFGILRVYELLIIFAIINVSSLFLRFVETFEFRLANSILLMVSLIFAIYYFFAYIIWENKLVKKQIYEDELYGLYCESDNYNHQEADVLTEMNGGSRRNKKLSTNVINYFNTYNSESQQAFEEIFGSNSLLYDYSRKARRKLKKKYDISPYVYRNNSKGVHDISYEFFQLFRYSELQDKWTIEILRAFDGDRIICRKYEILRLYNFARVITHLNSFGYNDNIYKYKFLEHLIDFYYQAVSITNEEVHELQNAKKVKKVERYILDQLVHFMFRNGNNQRDSIFNNKAKIIMEDIILGRKYHGTLETNEVMFLFLDKVLEIENEFIQHVFTEILDKYYIESGEKKIPETLKIEYIKNYINRYKKKSELKYKVSTEELFRMSSFELTT